ncbi:hypothetical protein BHU62_20895 [Serratia marcescens]|uniref:Uncharacterized protein n=1 Tax=Serratia marcescens TaxID=615 RepID=A0A1Q4NV46_SERMA|nr:MULTISPECIES: hypothetical protein [Serratia]MCP1105975.1 hypothetical protein [Serratia nevei]OKB64756.1 hypothetical protein BHU62_20895 [Serratia marcescens]
MKMNKVILIGFVALMLAGCGDRFSFISGFVEKDYTATKIAPTLGYIDYQSSELLGGDREPIYVILTYNSNKELYKQRKISVQDVHPDRGALRLYVPAIEGMKFETMDINLEYGTIRVVNGDSGPESNMRKRLERGVSRELVDKGKKVSIKSGMVDAGPYYGLMLRAIRK